MKIYLCFLLRILQFQLLHFLTNFELIFIYGVKKGPNFILLHVDTQLTQHHLLKRLFFPPLIVWLHFQKSIALKCKGLFLNFQFYSINLYVCYYASNTPSWLLQVCSKFVDNVSHSTLFFLKIVLAILGPLNFDMYFRISLSISTRKPAGILISIWGVLPF